MNGSFQNTWPGWETVQLIGRGSFGAVYEIQRDVLGETEKAALKVISIPQNSGDIEELYSDGYDEESITSTFQSHLKSIVAEYTLMRKMNGCTNIVNCDDVRYVQHDDGIGWDIFIKMELLTPLTKAFTGPMEEETVVQLAKDICTALELCKKLGIVHRDIKPQNIFVSPNGDFKLGDFGIAKTVEKTMGGTKIGTYKYMAPEVYNNQPYGTGADIYSLGLVLYWLLNERRMPFLPLPPEKLKAGMDDAARQRRLTGETLPPPARGSEKLKNIVLKACAYEQKDRYATASEMKKELEELNQPIVVPVVSSVIPVQETSVQDDAENVRTEAKQLSDAVDVDGAKTEKKNKKVIPILIGGVAAMGVAACLLVAMGIGNHGDVGPSEELNVPPETTEATSVTLPSETETTPRPTVPSTEPTVVYNWSEWLDALPNGISSEKYEIETLTQYRSRKLETTSSTTQSSMDGWELYDTIEGTGEFGNWSDWSSTKVTATEDREVETQTQYRYRTKETTTSSSSSLSGWTLYDTTYSWSDYGNWSDWSTTAVYDSDSRDVESKTQYRYRDITYTTKYTEWSSWGSWSDTAITETDLVDVETRTVYHYSYFKCDYCGNQQPTWGTNGGCYNCHGAVLGSSYRYFYIETPYSSASHWDGDIYFVIDPQYGRVFTYPSTSSPYYMPPKTQYRSRTRTTYEEPNYGNWSNWGDTPYRASSNREVETRTVYRYRDRTQIATYHFWRWGSWSSWSATAISGSSERDVETTEYYRYRERVRETTYYFRRWGGWTDYSNTPIAADDVTDVEQRTQYRYKKKQ